jgi:hypothetical protein
VAGERRARHARDRVPGMCPYHWYESTYQRAAEAGRAHDEATVSQLRAWAGRITPDEGAMVATALDDAATGRPMRSRVHLCRLGLAGACANGACLPKP